jgi:lipid-A-disaccharide synthase
VNALKKLIESQKNIRRILIVAGEASGDLYGAKLVTELKRQHPKIYFFGMGGKLMRKAGVKVLVKNEELALVGLVDVLINFRKIHHAFKKIKYALEHNHPDLVILIDYPGFNLRLAPLAKEAGTKVLYYISPQIWAWRPGRIKIIQRYVDHMAVILPFEVDLYKNKNVPVTFVKHPLLEIAKPIMSIKNAKKFFDLSLHKKIVSLMPGSRKSEIKYLLPIMLKAAELLKKRFEKLEFILPIASSLTEKDLAPYLAKTDLSIKLSKDPKHNYDLMRVSDAAIVASGTATLEMAIIGTPFLIIYKTALVNYWLSKVLMKVPFLGLPNLIAKKMIVAELLQNRATPEAISNEVAKILTKNDYRKKIVAELHKVKRLLNTRG